MLRDRWQPTGAQARRTTARAGAQVRSRLDDVLHDRCVHVDAGAFWAYQFCYGRQSDSVPRGGGFSRDDSARSVFGNSVSPGRWWARVPKGRSFTTLAVRMGAACAETGERRRALVRYLCEPTPSSDVGIRVEVREPRLCEYELSVYLAELCDVLD